MTRPDVFATRDDLGRPCVTVLSPDGVGAVDLPLAAAAETARRIAECADRARAELPQAPGYLRLVVDNRPRRTPPAA